MSDPLDRSAVDKFEQARTPGPNVRPALREIIIRETSVMVKMFTGKFSTREATSRPWDRPIAMLSTRALKTH